MKRFIILCACVLVLMFLGTAQAWSVFVTPLRLSYALSAFQTQLIFNTSTFCFCIVIIPAGRFHDRYGPRLTVAVGALIVGLAWLLAYFLGGNYFYLWLSMGVLSSTGNAVGYVCPLATALKWFPGQKGLVSGLAAAGFAGGPILLSTIAEALFRRGWNVLEIFGAIGILYMPMLLLLALLLIVPPRTNLQQENGEISAFRISGILPDRRFWTFFLGMFVGTLPFLTLMGNVKPIMEQFGVGHAALGGFTASAIAVPMVASGNVCGRIVWGFAMDRLGPRRSILLAQSLMIISLLALLTFGKTGPGPFLAAAFGVGFCYGSNFSIYPATIARVYGTHLLGSIYPLIMAAQAMASFAPTINGGLFDLTGSYFPGLGLALAAAVAGMLACRRLSLAIASLN